MNPVHEVRLIAGRELRKTFRSAKGIVLAALSLTAGGLLSLLFAWVERMRVEKLSTGVATDADAAATIRAMQEGFYAKLYGPETAHFLADAPYALWVMLMVTLGGIPLLVALLGFDGISGEVGQRTVRFWAVRARRASYVFGKLVGLWITVLAVTLATNVIVGVAVAWVGRVPVIQVLFWGLRLDAVTLPVSLAWCAIATLVGVQFRAPMLALLWICATMFGLWIVRVVAGLKGVDALAYVDPNAYDWLLVSPRASDVAGGVAGLLALTAAAAAAAAWSFERKDV
ncbi:MAG: ABC transporter permease subunit [Polyangiaceae bacterium]|nr:ABC transporter permease subunit [Polyangiaceae bacterium]